MKILLEYCQTQTVVKNSRFIAEAFVVEDAKSAREKLLEQKKKYFDATHVCHAFVTGLKQEVNGMSDDGEPSGTAGRPMLDVVKGSGITNIMVTVTRYFGGTLLGTGGLVKAYGDATKAVLEICKAEEYVEKSSFTFHSDYAEYSGIKRIMESYEISSLNESYGDGIDVAGQIVSAQKDALFEQIKNFTRGKILLQFN